MPPKKKGSKATDSSKKTHEEDEAMSSGENEQTGDEGIDQNEDAMSVDADENPKKRKSPPTEPASEPDPKAAKQSGNASNITARQILNFLLSADALPLCYPSDDLEAGKAKSSTKTYSLTPPSNFTPFEQLVTAHLLSKPLSHVLGMRSIRTLLNPPYAFNTASAVTKAGEKRVWEALEDAKTQHRQKTASYLYQLGQAYEDSETMLALAEEANEQGSGGVITHIKETVKGMGETGAQIFCRRIQCVDGWGEAVWPYADPRALDALKELGVDVKDGDDLQGLVEEYVDWDKVGQMGLRRLTGTGREVEVEDDSGDGTGKIEDMDHEQRIQVEFVVLLERAVGAVLEGNAAEVKKAAAAAASK